MSTKKTEPPQAHGTTKTARTTRPSTTKAEPTKQATTTAGPTRPRTTKPGATGAPTTKAAATARKPATKANGPTTSARTRTAATAPRAKTTFAITPVHHADQVVFDRWRLEQCLQSGRFGETWLAAPVRRSATRVVIKFANTAFQQGILGREIELLRTCQHRHVVKMLDSEFDNSGRATALVMPYAGQSWADVFGARPAELATLLPMAAQIAKALDAMHKVSALHLDIKPANLAVDAKGSACVLDFGVAAQGQQGRPSVNGATMFVTRNAGISDRYAAPEHRDPHRGMDKYADQYSLAVTLLDLIEGTAVSQARLPVEHGSARLPPDGNKAIVRALKLEPTDRHKSCVAFVAALRRGCAA